MGGRTLLTSLADVAVLFGLSDGKRTIEKICARQVWPLWKMLSVRGLSVAACVESGVHWGFCRRLRT